MHLKQQKHISSYQRQSGWTMWSLMFVLGVLMLFAYIGFQLVPVYTTNESVKKAMRLAIDNTGSNITRGNIIRLMNSKLVIDGADELLDYKKAVDLKRTQRDLIMTVNYEQRVELFYNLSLVATFNNEVKREL